MPVWVTYFRRRIFLPLEMLWPKSRSSASQLFSLLVLIVRLKLAYAWSMVSYTRLRFLPVRAEMAMTGA